MVPRANTCDDCQFVSKTSSGLRQHINACIYAKRKAELEAQKEAAQRRLKRRKKKSHGEREPKRVQHPASVTGGAPSAELDSSDVSPVDSERGDLTDSTPEVAAAAEDDEEGEDDLELNLAALGLNDAGTTFAEGFDFTASTNVAGNDWRTMLDQTGPAEDSNDDAEGGRTAATSASIRWAGGRKAASSAPDNCTRTTFKEATGRAAGTGLRRNESVAREPHEGFEEGIDVAFADWAHRNLISLRALDELLKEDRMAPLVDRLSWKTAVQYVAKMNMMGTAASEELGNWQIKEITIPAPHSPSGFNKYTLRYRSVEAMVRFALSNRGFKEDLVYEPYQEWDNADPPNRVYTDMASAEWWWETQAKIPVDGATVVPLIIASDKSQVTNHAGDLNAHAVYLSIGNLAASARNGNDRPGSIPLALLPIVQDDDADERSRVFHECLRVIFDPVMHISDGEGIDVACADGWTRRCFPIVSVLAIDYEEQAKITGVKYLRHCTQCVIKPDQRGDLLACEKWRTHAHTKRLQDNVRNGKGKNKILPSDDDWVHDVPCFAWGHRYVNIHRTLMPDILHQLLKGVIKNTYDWTVKLLQDKLPQTKGRRWKHAVKDAEEKRQRARQGSKAKKKRTDKEMALDVIDRRFASVPGYKDLRIYKSISRAKQWTGSQSKSLVRQMMPVFTPLLEDCGREDAIQFLRAIVDFTMLALYRSHDHKTLGYMVLALYRMNAWKEAFRQYRPEDKDAGEGHFNIPKFHALTHYIDMIIYLGNCPDLETGHFESDHIRFLKRPFKLTNKRFGWEDQIMEHFRRWLNMRAQFESISTARRPNAAEKTAKSDEPAQPSDPIDVRELGLLSAEGEDGRTRKVMWRTVAQVVEFLGERSVGKRFRQAVAAFVRESRSKDMRTPEGEIVYDSADIVDDDEWVLPLRLQFHRSVRCWKRTGKDFEDHDAQELDFVRCTPKWMGQENNNRYDWMLVQNTAASNSETRDASDRLDGMLPARLRFVITMEDAMEESQTRQRVQDIRLGQLPPQPARYTGVFVDLYEPVDPIGLANNIHGMTVIQPLPQTPQNGRLRGKRMYGMAQLHHSIHVVPVDETDTSGKGRMYINNTADHGVYNLLFNEDWEDDAWKKAREKREERLEDLRLRTAREDAEDGAE